MASKTLQRFQVEKSQKMASSPKDWRDLAQKALAAAERAQDKRAPGLRLALEAGRAPQVLRMMSIICENDIAREFPPSTT